ncbi:MAG: SinI restriction endonuclease [Lentisphaerae bacterium ADurb.Bin242]|nr:MAG: SinI restriction endonuclease [Lentisphaerae bacterium ADurb.Bin242]
MNNAVAELGRDKVCAKAIRYATELKVPGCLHIEHVCNVCCSNPELAPSINGNKKKNILSADQCIEQWVRKFLHGYKERISLRQSKMPGTVPDHAVSIIIKAVLPKLSTEQANSVVYAHRLGMSAENILGLLLEEFLFQKLSPLGWAMAWGETIKSVDFCNADGSLLQIKNRSNSENSSSSKIRDGKPIEKWFRVNATNGRCEWEKLSETIGQTVTGLDEENFQEFIQVTLAKNPKALAIEGANPWLSFKSELEETKLF